MSIKYPLWKWGAGLAAIATAFAVDDPVTGSLQLHSTNWAWHLARFLSQVGDWQYVLIPGLLCSAFLFWRGRFEASRLLLLALAAATLTGLGATVIRSVTCRTRPDSTHPQGFYGPWHDSHWIIGKYEFGSFPSGHTATLAGLAVAAWLLDRRLGAAAALFTVAVAWSRLALWRHHFSDVVAAAVFAVFFSPWIFQLMETSTRERWGIWRTRRQGMTPRGQ
jgi:membrane-associated phospholipid phosphatase